MTLFTDYFILVDVDDERGDYDSRRTPTNL